MTFAAQQRAQSNQVLGAAPQIKQFNDTRPTAEIYAEIGYLRNALDQLSTATSMLVERVSPVLMSPGPSAVSTGEIPLPPQAVVTTNLGSEIQSLRHAVLGITATVNDTFERLAL